MKYLYYSFFFFPPVSFLYKHVNETKKSKILMSLNKHIPNTEVQIFDRNDHWFWLWSHVALRGTTDCDYIIFAHKISA